MTTLFTIMCITIIWCLGITIVTQPYMALGGVRRWAELKKSKWMEPLILCEWCMPSIHSLIGYAFAVAMRIIPPPFSFTLMVMYPLVVMGSSFITGVLWSVYKLIESKTRHLKNLEQLSHFDISDRKTKFKNARKISSK